jgi:methionine-rich copper-binding protein CopC
MAPIAILALAFPLAAQSLKVARPVVSQSEDGPALEKGAAFQPGDLAFFSFQVENYRMGLTGKVQLTGHIEVFDANGTPIMPRDEESIGTTLSQEDKNWKPKMRLEIQVPSIAPPGNYTIRFEAIDQQSHQTASGEVAFPVGGKGVEPSPALVIRTLGFYRSEEDETPLKTVAYRPGDMLRVRFDLTGYKYGEQNSIDVGYDVEVLSPGGKQLFAEEDAAVEKSQAFYPQPWVPASFNLDLQPNMSPGTYTLVITAHDAVVSQKAVARAEFKVE